MNDTKDKDVGSLWRSQKDRLHLNEIKSLNPPIWAQIKASSGWFKLNIEKWKEAKEADNEFFRRHLQLNGGVFEEIIEQIPTTNKIIIVLILILN